MPGDIQTPNTTHASATRICELIFHAVGLRAERVTDYKDGYDFRVGGRVRVACRYAMPTSDRQQIYKKRNGETSTYSYKRWTFNFHRHGRIPDRYCDFFICLLVGPDAVLGRVSAVSVFVIPWDAITGLTFCSSIREGSSRGYRGKYALYRDAWHLLEKAAHGKRAGIPTRKSLKISADGRRRLKLILAGEGDGSSSTAVVANLSARRLVRNAESKTMRGAKQRVPALRLRLD